ncbi:flagellar basal body P-ring formation chaperone FlgA [Candidatus Chrysopegis kryptomonas]|uniref:Flagella basal body P-ring formation protein FlgA n=1 Tax=Candidatus Chryseopegocella kryptomonas TaxID=1633643 RepID=A0A0P1MXC4_9BACT|nr:flagellar basal body P-ring formation chaperone FlgA [Candidatus Chrysopegis kryptomonas]CUT00380.1 flagella basal body P-ring formation protein FlgA [Candidatus Chrysopegis kryptomonas]
MKLLAMKICVALILFQMLNAGSDVEERSKSEIVKFLSGKFPERKIDFVINLKKKFDANLFNESCEIKIVKQMSSGFKGYQSFEFKVCSGDSVKEIIVQAFVRAFENVLIAKKDLKRGEVFDSEGKLFEFIGFEKIETTFLRDDYAVGVNSVLGKRLKMPVRKGDVVFMSYFEDLPMVKAGEKVKLIATVGTVKIETTGIAKKDGKLNDVVRVLNPESGKLLYGKVIGKGIVAVEIEN